jgi:hypothetical protein
MFPNCKLIVLSRETSRVRIVHGDPETLPRFRNCGRGGIKMSTIARREPKSLFPSAEFADTEKKDGTDACSNS